MNLSFLRAGLALCLTFTASTTMAAKIIQPPIQDLLKEHYRVSVLELQSKDDEKHQGHFENVRNLWGETPDEITLNVPAEWLEKMEEDEKYIIGHSRFRKHPILRDVIELNPDGPSVVGAYVVNYAIFDDSSELRYLFEAVQEKELNERKILDRTLELLDESEGATRLLAAFQFQMSEPLFAEGIRGSHLDTLKDVILSNRLSAEEEEFVLRATRQFTKRYRDDWIAEHCRLHIDQHEQPYDLGSYIPLLVKTCTEILAVDGGLADTPRLGKLLHVNAPGVAKSALKALQELAPEQVPQIVAEALNNREQLHPETLRVLQAYMSQHAAN